MRGPHDGGLAESGMIVQDVFYLGRVDVLAPDMYMSFHWSTSTKWPSWVVVATSPVRSQDHGIEHREGRWRRSRPGAVTSR
jgi:hypothetical protein